MNKKYTAELIQNRDGTVGWAVRCEHLDDDFRVETIARCNPNNQVVGYIWAQRIAVALNKLETTDRVDAEFLSVMAQVK